MWSSSASAAESSDAESKRASSALICSGVGFVLDFLDVLLEDDCGLIVFDFLVVVAEVASAAGQFVSTDFLLGRCQLPRILVTFALISACSERCHCKSFQKILYVIQCAVSEKKVTPTCSGC